MQNYSDSSTHQTVDAGRLTMAALLLIGLMPIRKGRVLPESEFSPNPSDLRHHGQLIPVKDSSGRRHLFGEATLQENDDERKRFLDGKAVRLPYELSDQDGDMVPVEKNRVLAAAGGMYEIVTDPAAELKEGQARDGGLFLELVHVRSRYAHCLVCLSTDDQQLVVISIDNCVQNHRGLSYAESVQFALDQGCDAAIVVDDGFDRCAIHMTPDGHWIYTPGGRHRSRFSAAIVVVADEGVELADCMERRRIPVPGDSGIEATITRFQLPLVQVKLSMSPNFDNRGFQRGFGPAFYENEQLGKVTCDYGMRTDCLGLPTHVERISRELPEGQHAIAGFSLGNLGTNREFLAAQIGDGERTLIGREDEVQNARRGRKYSALAFGNGEAWLAEDVQLQNV